MSAPTDQHGTDPRGTDPRATELQAELDALTLQITAVHARLSGNGPASADPGVRAANAGLRRELAEGFTRHRVLTAEVERLVRPRRFATQAPADGSGR